MKILNFVLFFLLIVSCKQKHRAKEFTMDKRKDTKGLFYIKMLSNNKDTLVDLNYLKQDFVVSTQIEFNYPKLEDKFFKNSFLILKNDTIEVKIKEVSFNKKTHKLIYRDSLKIPKKYGLFKIDGEKYYGTDGEIPKTEIESIIIKMNGNRRAIKNKFIKDLFNANFTIHSTDAYVAKDKLILTFTGSDGAGAYFSTFIIKNGKVEDRILNYGY